MSKNVVIKEGDSGSKFGNVRRLVISNQGSDTSDWVPSDEFSMDDINITDNGLYTARKNNLFAYNQVNVNVVKPLVIDNKVYSTNNGYITQTSLPAFIKVTKEPDDISYDDMGDVNLTGIEVTAYNEDGSVWTSSEYPDGIIPEEELRVVGGADFNHEVRTSTEFNGYVGNEIPVDWMTIITMKHRSFDGRSSAGARGRYDNLKYTVFMTCATVFVSSGLTNRGVPNFTALVASKSGGNVASYLIDMTHTDLYGGNARSDPKQWMDIVTDSSFTHNEKTAYYAVVSLTCQTHNANDKEGHNSLVIDSPPVGLTSTADNRRHFDYIAWIALYGEKKYDGVTIAWNRPVDNLELTTTFDAVLPPHIVPPHDVEG